MLGLSNAVMCGQKAVGSITIENLAFLAGYSSAGVMSDISGNAINIGTPPTSTVVTRYLSATLAGSLNLSNATFSHTTDFPWTLDLDVYGYNYRSISIVIDEMFTLSMIPANGIYFDDGVNGVSGGAMSQLTWYEIRLTYNADVYSLYVNNIFKGTLTKTFASRVGGFNIQISGFENGFIESLRYVKNAALTAAPVFPLSTSF